MGSRPSLLFVPLLGILHNCPDLVPNPALGRQRPQIRISSLQSLTLPSFAEALHPLCLLFKPLSPF